MDLLLKHSTCPPALLSGGLDDDGRPATARVSNADEDAAAIEEAGLSPLSSPTARGRASSSGFGATASTSPAQRASSRFAAARRVVSE